MLSVILSTPVMLLSFQVLLALMGLLAIARIVKELRGRTNFEELAAIITRPVLTRVFPVILLALLTAIDPTHVIVLVFFYLAELFIAVHTIIELGHALKKM